MKEERLYIRIAKEEKEKLFKAAQGYRSVAAFLLSATEQAKKYRRLIEQAMELEKQGYKPSKMKVSV